MREDIRKQKRKTYQSTNVIVILRDSDIEKTHSQYQEDDNFSVTTELCLF
jgi:hypothetical protein